MTGQQSTFSIRLFYSYCHKDEQYRDSMEKALALLKQQSILIQWSDQSILPGQKISEIVRQKIDEADIIAFLLSQDFIASDECMKEWNYAKQLAASEKPLFRLPIILKDCAWTDLLANDDVKALPKDGNPVVKYEDENTAWHEVYEGIKDVIGHLRKNFTPKSDFLREMEETNFLSQHHIKLRDLYVFLPLSCHAKQTKGGRVLEEQITNQQQLLRKKYALIHGEAMSGKTSLGRHIFLSLVEETKPVLYMDLQSVPKKFREETFRDAYNSQFNGDYSLWKQQNDKTIILDNLSPVSHLIDFVVFAKDFFDKVIVNLPSDVFHSFFRDETRLADFCEMKIEPLTHRQQEELIKRRLALSDTGEPVTDGRIDQVENHVNSIITVGKIVPRYPFYVLSILQTYEGYMPSNLSISSQGHCYYVLILANLIKAGISRNDDDINACFNFAENLAFRIYQCTEQRIMETSDFDKFVAEYNAQYIIPESILNRLTQLDYGIITKNGRFKTAYMHYFFLGRFLSKNREEHKAVIDLMCKESHVTSNYLTLLFIIHHTNDNQIIDDILLRTMCTLDAVAPATLTPEETKRFGDIIGTLPENILSSDSVETERGKERDTRDIDDRADSKDKTDQTGDEHLVNDCYRVLKNNEILGQVLKNKYGSLERTKLEEIVETVADGGLRLVNVSLKDEEEIADLVRYLHKKHPEHDIDKIKSILQFLSFLWTMINVEQIVRNIYHPEISEVVNEVVRRRSTPAFDLIGYFSRLDSEKELTEEVKQELGALLKKHDQRFLKAVLSIRTQHYLNTHRNKASIEQSACSLLGIKYIPRHKHQK